MSISNIELINLL